MSSDSETSNIDEDVHNFENNDYDACEPGMFVSGWENLHEDELKETGQLDEKSVLCTAENVLAAARENKIDMLKQFLDAEPTLINAVDSDNYTPLHRACYSDNVEIVELLLERGANVRAKTIDGWQPLHSSCIWSHVRCASLLLQNGADPNARTNGNQTPLHLASANCKSHQTLELLLWQNGIDSSIVNDSGDTALEVATRTGKYYYLFEIAHEAITSI